MPKKSGKGVSKKVTKHVPKKSPHVGSEKLIEKVTEVVTNQEVIPKKPKKIKMKAKPRGDVIKDVFDADVQVKKKRKKCWCIKFNSKD